MKRDRGRHEHETKIEEYVRKIECRYIVKK